MERTRSLVEVGRVDEIRTKRREKWFAFKIFVLLCCAKVAPTLRCVRIKSNKAGCGTAVFPSPNPPIYCGNRGAHAFSVPTLKVIQRRSITPTEHIFVAPKKDEAVQRYTIGSLYSIELFGHQKHRTYNGVIDWSTD